MAFFFRRGRSVVKFLPAVAGASPTRPEITAGTDLSAQINGLEGFQFSNTRIDTPILSSSFTPQITGPDEVGDCTLTFLDNDASTTIRALLAQHVTGFIVLFPYGDVATKRCEVWSIISAGVNDEWSLGNDPARFAVGMAVALPPLQNATVPAV